MPVVLSAVGHCFDDAPWLFRGLDAVLEPGLVYALTGPSGSGKSTLLALLAGWMYPAEGSIDRGTSPQVSWVFQNPHGVAGRSAADHVALPLLARGITPSEADSQATAMLDRFGLAHLASRPFRALSGGEAQRLMLARGLASNPTLLLIDEPTAQLDHTTAETVNNAIAAAASENTIVVVATHDTRTRNACSAQIDLGDYFAPGEASLTSGLKQ